MVEVHPQLQEDQEVLVGEGVIHVVVEEQETLHQYHHHKVILVVILDLPFIMAPEVEVLVLLVHQHLQEQVEMVLQ